MFYKTIIKLTIKGFKFAVNRPLQRFNIYNRMKKYLGPDAKYFAPAPRAIGALSQRGGKPLQYPHLEGSGYKSIHQRRLEAIAKGDSDPIKLTEEGQPELPKKAFSETERDDRLVIEASQQFEVLKTITRIGSQQTTASLEMNQNDVLALEVNDDDKTKEKKHRPLPKLTNLQLQDPKSIWFIENKNTPPGRININQLQELMLNKLADDKYWTPQAVAERYNIKEDYAESLMKYLKQIRIIVSPRMKRALDYVGQDDPFYQSAKHLVYHADNSLRSKLDKQYDEMFLPGERLDDEVKEVLETPKTDLEPVRPKLVKRPEPLRISPVNKPKAIESK